jgi:hypothetical protein
MEPALRPASDGPTPRKLALIGPAFFSYVGAIADEFRGRGIPVVTFDERHSNRLVDKVFYRLGVYRHRYSPARRHLQRLLREIEASGVTDVLLANVEAVDRGFVGKLSAGGIRTHLYMWDSTRNKPGFAALLDLVTSRGTFDPVDAQRLNMTYIPLFAEAIFDRESVTGSDEPDIDIGFCGTVHSSRARILAQLRDVGRPRNLRLGLMLYYHSRMLFYSKGLIDRNVWGLAREVSSTPYSKADIAALFRRSRFVLDVQHPGQTGMTARTFEAILSGTRLLTFNKAAARLLPESLQPRIKVIDTIDEAGLIDYGSYGRLPALTADELYFLSLRRFVDQLVEMMRLDAAPVRTATPAGVSPLGVAGS